MSKIVQLSQHVANQIAAGEVVERPSSVVKELIENSIDAGSKNIEVRIKNGGLEQIVVQDDGLGMELEDILMALRRYATSKLSTVDDLDQIGTFGFRGEALPSIASVSKMSIVSRTNRQDHASRVDVLGGQIGEQSKAGSSIGTRIEVRDLFYNVPARLKFVKSKRAESGEIERLLKAYAFSYPHIGWRYFVDDKNQFSFAKDGSLHHERAQALLGKDTRGFLYPMSHVVEDMSIEGVICAPMVARRDARSIILFVNNRLIKDKRLTDAIRVAFRSLLEVGRSPVVALKIAISASEVDVNVHPRKSEVRFRNEREVFSDIIGAVGEFLAQTPWLRGDSDHFKNEPASLPSTTPFNSDNTRSYGYDFLLKPQTSTKETVYAQPSLGMTYTPPPATEEQKKLLSADKFSDLRAIGQVSSTYLLTESDEGLVVIDQHAAHERVMFEKIRREKANSIKRQDLLIPINIALDAKEMAFVVHYLEDFLALGIEIEIFGEENILVRSTPDFLKHCQVVDLIKDIISDLSHIGQLTSFNDLFDHVCATLACHSAIRAGQKMSKEEIEALLRSLDGTSFNAHCPHGRPLVKSFSQMELRKWFHRT